ncbi:hypothetical protein A2482_02065 [Candidatus Falkowbacteria bacterium RIFOXYC2_FULL_48_21]|uniref:ParE-like toxin domain-containing protein n=1 Tax=Candidatus Falkowbacteria bacterium RIFOXYC2_FULL_48_21 TaxID=1798005 RepID=A0A1F5T794_9BACT|nr:MAG: hypothetical protein A2482_02065 [Candidatus Falkowbacteria bacterium RIFOXYC2_FULL_48_21]
MERKIEYSQRFLRRLRKLPPEIAKMVAVKIALFKQDQFYPSLRLHRLRGALSGLWSISISGKYRAIFERQEDGCITFVTVGQHDIYKYL